MQGRTVMVCGARRRAARLALRAVRFFGEARERGHHRRVFEQLIIEGRRDASRPWWRRTTGGLLALVVLAAIAGGLAVELLGR